MKLPLLGIIIVLCLQLGFTAYNTIDLSFESLVAVKELTQGTNPVADTSDSLNSPDLIVSAANKRTNKHAAQAIFISSRKEVRIPSVTAVNRIAQYTVMQKPLESTVITYPRVVRVTAQIKTTQHPVARVAPRAEKRSFVSKSVSVFKKPYDWLKALGSKIN